VGSPKDVFKHTADAVFGIDKHMRIRFWNESCEKLFSIDHKQAVGQTCHEVICGNDLSGKPFCGKRCRIVKHHDKLSPNSNWDLVIPQNGGGNIVVNIGSYYPDNPVESDDTEIEVFHSMRAIDCYQIIRRFAFNSETTKEPNSINRLSKREYEILRMVSLGTKAKAIAQQLGVSHATVRNHIKNIYSKLEVHSQAEAINCAMRYGMV
jgi:DNA-binding CsgD family transcriptional regulator